MSLLVPQGLIAGGRGGGAELSEGARDPGPCGSRPAPGRPTAPRPVPAARPLPQVAAGVVLVVVLGLRVPEQHGCSSASAAPHAWQRSSRGPSRPLPVSWKPRSKAAPARRIYGRPGGGATAGPTHSGRAAGRGPPEAAHLADPLPRALPGSERASPLRDGRRRRGLGLRPRLFSRPQGWGPDDPHRGPDDLPRFSREASLTLRPVGSPLRPRSWEVAALRLNVRDPGSGTLRPLPSLSFSHFTLHSLKSRYFLCLFMDCLFHKNVSCKRARLGLQFIGISHCLGICLGHSKCSINIC